MGWCIYKHTNIYNGKSYIGQTSQLPNDRWKNGKGYVRKKGDNQESVFSKAIEKYLWENFTHEILEDNISSKEIANEREQYYIQFYRTYIGFADCNGYNMTLGGNNNSHLGKVVYQIDKKTLKVLNEFNDAIKASIYIDGTSNNASRIRSVCNGEKYSCKNFFWCYKENWFEGWKPRDNKLLSPVFQIDYINNEYKIINIYNSITEASEKNNFSRGSIMLCCQRKSAKANDYYWCYKKDWTLEWKPYKGKFDRNEKIYCFTNDTIYENASEASEKLNISSSKITRCCNGLLKHINKYQFCYLKDKGKYKFDLKANFIIKESYTEKDIQFLNEKVPTKGYKWCANQLGKTIGSVTQYVLRHLTVRPIFSEVRKLATPKNVRKVRCKTTGEIFENFTQAENKKKLEGYNCSASGIRRCCLGECKKSGKLEWEFA